MCLIYAHHSIRTRSVLLRPKVSGPDDWTGDEMFLEQLVAAKSR